MIQIEDLSKSFRGGRDGPVLALERLTFTVARGGVTAILGPNGSGKTTLLRILSGVIRPTSGRALIAGHDLASRPVDAQARIGLLTEEPGLPERQTPLWHVRLHAGLRGARPRASRARAREVLVEMGLASSLETPMGRLSKGNRQKVAIARAIVHDPEVLLLDEPTAGLDIETSILVRDLIASRAHRGRTILMATHDPLEAERLAGRIVILGKGRLLAHGSLETLRRPAGHGARLALRLAKAAPEAAPSLHRLPWVTSVRPMGEWIVIGARDPGIPPGALPDLVAAVAPVGIIEIRQDELTLEEVYLSLQKEVP